MMTTFWKLVFLSGGALEESSEDSVGVVCDSDSSGSSSTGTGST